MRIDGTALLEELQRRERAWLACERRSAHDRIWGPIYEARRMEAAYWRGTIEAMLVAARAAGEETNE